MVAQIKQRNVDFFLHSRRKKWPQNSIITDRRFFLPHSHGEKNYLRRVGRKKWNKDTELRSWCCFCSWVYFPYPKTRNWQILNHELWVEKKKNANEAWHRYATWISLIWPISVFKVFFLFVVPQTDFCFLLQKQNFLVWLLLYPVKVCKSDHWSKKKFHIWEMHEMPL